MSELMQSLGWITAGVMSLLWGLMAMKAYRADRYRRGLEYMIDELRGNQARRSQVPPREATSDVVLIAVGEYYLNGTIPGTITTTVTQEQVN